MIKKILQLLTRSERKRAFGLLLLSVIVGVIDTVGIASIMPFIAVLANPDIVSTNEYLSDLYKLANRLNVSSKEEFLFILGATFFFILIFSIILKAITTYLHLRFTLMRDYSIGKRLIEGYLNQPYSWFLGRNSAEIGKNILSEVGIIINHSLVPLINIIVHGTTSLLIVTLLIIVNPTLAVIIGLTFTLIYIFIFQITQKILLTIGQERLKANKERFSIVNESFSAVKEIKVSGLEQSYIKRFSKSAIIFANNQAKTQIISQLPRYALEGITFGGILLVILYLFNQNNNFQEVLPIISLYAFAGYKLIPALQHIYGAVTLIRSSKPALDELHEDFMGLNPIHKFDSHGIIPLKDLIYINNVSFSYPDSDKYALKDIEFKIKAGSRVGIVGSTGSGKTSLINIILGLLDPSQGQLRVDEKLISPSNKLKWQKNIGYVPQDIFLKDDTIAANIAFGENSQDVDINAVVRAARIANLHDFVDNELSKKYNTIVGERGVRISGGQRQRIGIARALYHNPQVLILDEATSALDNVTEQNVMNDIDNLKEEITIIIIAHRLSTVEKCETIFLLENGRLVDQGTYLKLIKENKLFRKMSKIQESKS